MERLKMHSLYLCKQRIERYELPTYTLFHASPIVPPMEIWENSRLPIHMVPYLH